MENEIILSICIPTDGTLRWVRQVLDGIYNQKCDSSKFEVVITDNGCVDELENYIKEKQFKNLTYQRCASKGFQNIIDSLKLGNGLFCKVLNHRAILLPGILNEWLKIIEQYKAEKPMLYFADGSISGDDYIRTDDLNSFVATLSFNSSDMAGIGIWDVDKHQMDNIVYDELFPNTSLLFEIRQESKYVIINKKFYSPLESKGKGGYNLFKTFAVGYLDILNDLRCRDRVTIATFIKVKSDLLHWFCPIYYTEVVHGNTEHKFDFTDIKKYMQVYYSEYDYYTMKLKAYCLYATMPIRHFSNKVRSSSNKL